ncbi:hypothetical protein, partial [Endozoicomonas sp. ONNA2]|uniref:hypothetical protein n=1 Tax=Endozoicomonas sp. ONNA2 TaxID=2828741 RepID=UPI0021479D9E
IKQNQNFFVLFCCKCTTLDKKKFCLANKKYLPYKTEIFPQLIPLFHPDDLMVEDRQDGYYFQTASSISIGTT